MKNKNDFLLYNFVYLLSFPFELDRFIMIFIYRSNKRLKISLTLFWLPCAIAFHTFRICFFFFLFFLKMHFISLKWKWNKKKYYFCFDAPVTFNSWHATCVRTCQQWLYFISFHSSFLQREKRRRKQFDIDAAIVIIIIMVYCWNGNKFLFSFCFFFYPKDTKRQPNEEWKEEIYVFCFYFQEEFGIKKKSFFQCCKINSMYWLVWIAFVYQLNISLLWTIWPRNKELCTYSSWSVSIYISMCDISSSYFSKFHTAKWKGSEWNEISKKLTIYTGSSGKIHTNRYDVLKHR